MWKTEGSYELNGELVVITDEDGGKATFTIELSGDTIMRNWKYTQLILRKTDSKEVYTLFHPKELIEVEEK